MEKEKIIDYIASIVYWFISSAFIMWGWNTLAPHINCPLFSYWEIFAIRMGVSYALGIIVKSFKKLKEVNENEN